MEEKILGVLGGLGPMSSVWFYEMLTAHTKAERDQDHLDILISSRASTPDRTAYILGDSDENPVDAMSQEVERLTRAGAGIIAIPCNTAHSFYEKIAETAKVPIINIIEQTVLYCRFAGVKNAGVLATKGTLYSQSYERALRRAGIGYIPCDAEETETISDIIYGCVKQGKEVDPDDFLRVADALTARGCDRIILGCTELSLIKKKYRLGKRFVDSLEVLALSSIRLCGKIPCGFDADLMNFIPGKEISYAFETSVKKS